MLSILIPLYNYNIVLLVEDLIRQIRKSSVLAEILIVDDASELIFNENKQLEKYDEVRYYAFEANKGRSAARNFLADQAKYQHLLFIDCDAKVLMDNYLSEYYKNIDKQKKVICGGLEYPPKKDLDNAFLLRWHYGKKREQRTIRSRIDNPYQSFSSFNFLIPKDVFLNIKFPKEITSYGHEDTFFGFELKKHGIEIQHINNPLMHMGLEKADVFIQKTEVSVQNLDKLVELINDKELLKNNLKIFRYISLVKRLRLKIIFRILFNLFKPLIIKNLLSSKPSLILFDFYKLTYYFHYSR